MKPDAKRTPHQSYYNKQGLKVPGVTTILNSEEPKFGLYDWIWQCGVDGIDYKQVRDSAGDRGTLAHKMMENKLLHKRTKYDDYTATEITQAKNAYKSFNAWLKDNPIKEIIAIEKQLVSNEYDYGGTIDIYCFTDCYELIDIKTSKHIYDSHLFQLAPYKRLLTENGYPVDKCRIVQLPIDKSSNYNQRYLTDEEFITCFHIFLNDLSNYQLKKGVK